MERAERGCSRLDNSGRVSPCLRGGSLAQPRRLFAGFSALVNPSTPEEQCQEPPQKRAVTCWGDTKHFHFPEGGCVLCRVPRPRGGLGITRADGEPLSTSSSVFFFDTIAAPATPTITNPGVCVFQGQQEDPRAEMSPGLCPVCGALPASLLLLFLLLGPTGERWLGTVGWGDFRHQGLPPGLLQWANCPCVESATVAVVALKEGASQLPASPGHPHGAFVG